MKKDWPEFTGLNFSHWALLAGCALLLFSCAPSSPTKAPLSGNDNVRELPVSNTASPTVQVVIPTAQPTAASISYGPNPEDFPPGINPLTGEAVSDPTLLKIPALLVSVSNFPVTARPQAGLSFAPYVFEFSITEGQSRFLAAFYGQFPAPEVPMTGNCSVRSDIFKQAGTLLGNRVLAGSKQERYPGSGRRWNWWDLR